MNLIDWDFRLETECVKIALRKDNRKTFRKGKEGDWTLLVCPDTTNLNQPSDQQKVLTCLEGLVRMAAKEQLPGRLKLWSEKTGLTYELMKINTAHTRWGSCSCKVKRSWFGLKRQSGYHIHLSMYLVLLPVRLQDLVILHELTHTLEMNHSARFHALLNQLVDGKEKELERELKKYSTSIFSFV